MERLAQLVKYCGDSFVIPVLSSLVDKREENEASPTNSLPDTFLSTHSPLKRSASEGDLCSISVGDLKTRIQLTRRNSLPDLAKTTHQVSSAITGQSLEIVTDPGLSKEEQRSLNTAHANGLKTLSAPSHAIASATRAATAVFYTAWNFFYYQFYGGLTFEPHPNPLMCAAQSRIANTSQMLAGSDVMAFTSAIKTYTPLYTINSFYSLQNVAINTYSLEKIKQIIDRSSVKFKAPNVPICIPVTVKDSFLDPSHIVLIFIKDGTLEYYDSKAKSSSAHTLADGNTLENVLEYLKTKFNTQEPLENPFEQQIDMNSCGVFVCRQIYKRIVQGKINGSMDANIPTSQELDAFRGLIIALAYPLPNEKVQNYVKSRGLEISLKAFNDFPKLITKFSSVSIPESKLKKETAQKMYDVLYTYAQECLKYFKELGSEEEDFETRLNEIAAKSINLLSTDTLEKLREGVDSQSEQHLTCSIDREEFLVEFNNHVVNVDGTSFLRKATTSLFALLSDQPSIKMHFNNFHFKDGISCRFIENLPFIDNISSFDRSIILYKKNKALPVNEAYASWKNFVLGFLESHPTFKKLSSKEGYIDVVMDRISRLFAKEIWEDMKAGLQTKFGVEDEVEGHRDLFIEVDPVDGLLRLKYTSLFQYEGVHATGLRTISASITEILKKNFEIASFGSDTLQVIDWGLNP